MRTLRRMNQGCLGGLVPRPGPGGGGGASQGAEPVRGAGATTEPSASPQRLHANHGCGRPASTRSRRASHPQTPASGRSHQSRCQSPPPPASFQQPVSLCSNCRECRPHGSHPARTGDPRATRTWGSVRLQAGEEWPAEGPQVTSQGGDVCCMPCSARALGR